MPRGPGSVSRAEGNEGKGGEARGAGKVLEGTRERVGQGPEGQGLDEGWGWNAKKSQGVEGALKGGRRPRGL